MNPAAMTNTPTRRRRRRRRRHQPHFSPRTHPHLSGESAVIAINGNTFARNTATTAGGASASLTITVTGWARASANKTTHDSGAMIALVYTATHDKHASILRILRFRRNISRAPPRVPRWYLASQTALIIWAVLVAQTGFSISDVKTVKEALDINMPILVSLNPTNDTFFFRTVSP